MKKELTDLPVIAHEMLDGLEAGVNIRERILAASKQASHKGFLRIAVPVCATALLVAAGIAVWVSSPKEPSGVPIEIHAAGDTQLTVVNPNLRADLPGGSLSIGSGGVSAFRSLFAGDAGNFPLIGYDGRAYRMMTSPGSLGSGSLGASLGDATHVNDPSQAASGDWYGLISNAADADSAVYALAGLSTKTAVAATVNGQTRLFQRFTYGGYGPSGDSLESVLDVRGKVKSLDLSNVGQIADSSIANALAAVLLDSAVLKGNDVSRDNQALNIELKSGLVLQLFVSKSTLSACGAWSCPEFFEAYQAEINKQQSLPVEEYQAPNEENQPPTGENQADPEDEDNV